jgi:hypothetical protein
LCFKPTNLTLLESNKKTAGAKSDSDKSSAARFLSNAVAGKPTRFAAMPTALKVYLALFSAERGTIYSFLRRNRAVRWYWHFTESLHVFVQDQNGVIERSLDKMIQAVNSAEQQQGFTQKFHKSNLFRLDAFHSFLCRVIGNDLR